MGYLLQGRAGEPPRTKVAGFYRTQALAEAMVHRALRLPGMKLGQVRMLGPHDAHHSGRDLMLSPPEARRKRGLVRTVMRARSLAGLAGALVGLLVGGLISVPPAHVKLIHQLRSALRAGEWAVVLHPSDAHQATLSKDLLDSSIEPMIRPA